MIKPDMEIICLARKPLIGTVAENVMEHGTGALNIDGCRVEGEPWSRDGKTKMCDGWRMRPTLQANETGGRWPANVIHDGSPEVVEAFPETETGGGDKRGGCKFFMNGDTRAEPTGHEADSGSAARFFYTVKPDTEDEIGMENLANGRVTLHCGDCIDVMASLPDNSIDSVVCDPPYHLTSIVKRFGKEGSAPAKEGVFGRGSKGFMGKSWDGGDIAFRVETWAEVFRVLKPGGHLLAFSGTRTYHRMACAIEDAGFEIRDQIAWMYGSGFPKSHDVGKAIDKRLGAEREVIGQWNIPGRGKRSEEQKYGLSNDTGNITAPGSDLAAQWSGWGTALKPALEPICLARKPLIGTVAENVLEHGTGAINIDGCRVEGTKPQVTQGINSNATSFNVAKERRISGDPNEGRWPANVIHSGEPEVVEAFPETADSPKGLFTQGGDHFSIGSDKKTRGTQFQGHGDSGSAARFFKECKEDVKCNLSKRFFYTAKAGADDRLGSKHPTVKPLDLMQYLCRLVTPKGGTVLDPFAGTGTTGEAAFREGFNAVLIERETEYQADIRRRMSLVLGGPEERRNASIKAKGLVEDAGPLFGGLLLQATQCEVD